MPVAQWVKDMVEEVCPCSLEIGKRVKHPDGHMVEITNGAYWGAHGVSNFWYWRRVLRNGKLAKKEECGYGW